ncbi:hypothetical protein K227x_53200 [Rubripirellula lacrimiformis]|uniref:Uncharacterized protein n=1 Tax=Rubripirellula lacrimiformis TaxID=1930273 RepID=A0A517NID4_9BACT|nr:hypothetical protein [Rubripirellula lacrimiformis]QDT06897.1 hypothetical protein K227x_53200 [Rubripirellula lacrimiformis]
MSRFELLAAIEQLDAELEAADEHHAKVTAGLQFELFCIDRQQDETLADQRHQVTTKIEAANAQLEAAAKSISRQRAIAEKQIQQLNADRSPCGVRDVFPRQSNAAGGQLPTTTEKAYQCQT